MQRSRRAIVCGFEGRSLSEANEKVCVGRCGRRILNNLAFLGGRGDGG